MADENNTTNQSTTEPTTTEPHGAVAQGEEQWRANSRKWEGIAKANLEKAKAYDELVAKQKEEEPALEALQKKVATLESEAKTAREEAQRQTLLNKVSAETGVPATLIQGATEEEMSAYAKNVLAFVDSRAPKMPADKGGGASTKPLTSEEISKIKDPQARLRARAAKIAAEM